jgi:tRNA-specific adenosine deaminase 3
MCSMALLHSRVAKVMYLIPMDKTGGCGGSARLPRLEGVNHKFGILKWKEGHRVNLGLSEEDLTRLEVGNDLDA